MSAILATQPGPLTWVKPEIDFALERARASLATYFADPSQNGDALSAAIASVREVTGALQIIGMEALGSFSKEVDAVLDALAKQEVASVPELRDLLDRASMTLEQYLCTLMAGAPENAMCLLPLMDELARARGGQSVDDRVLFHPDLNVFPPLLVSGALLEGDALCNLVKLQRGHFQRGMLSWLRQSEDGLVRMRDALKEVERAQPAPGSRAPWWVASAFVEGLLHGGLATSDDTKRAAGRIDRYLAACASGVPVSTSAELIRELLFHLTHCEPVTPLVRDVKSLYRLDRCVAPSATPHVVEIDTMHITSVLRQTQDLLNLAMHAWTGSGVAPAEAAGEFQSCLASLVELVTDLGNQPMIALTTAMQSVVASLAVLDSDRRATVILEMAAAMIAIEKRLEDRKFAMPEATAEFNAFRRRLLANASGAQTACREDRGATCEPGSPPREDRELLQVVASEISATLQQVEKSLDAFFRGHVPIPSLDQLPGLMRSVTGALSVLGVESAAQLIDRCTSVVVALETPGHIISDEETTLLAEGLSSVMLYVQALDHGNREELRAVETILARFDAREALLASSCILDFQTTAEDGQPTQPGELDFDLLASSPEARMTSIEGEDSEAFQDGEEVTKAELAAILDHFDLSALHEEPESEAIGLDSQAEPSGLLDTQAAQKSDASNGLAADLKPDGIVVNATAQGVDPEIVSIFLEEANELLDAMGELLARARAEPDDWRNLTTLRRSYHTLKGSGRMAGLHAIGDAAWSIESLLNRWLEAERPASEELIKLTALGRDLFTGWIADVAQHGRTTVRTTSLSAQAHRVAQELAESLAGTMRAATIDDAGAVAMASLDMTMDAPAAEPVSEVVPIGVSTLPAPLFRIFVEEARQNVEALRIGLASLGPGADDEIADAVIRAAHTLGGIARTAGFPDIAVVASVIENAPLGNVDCPKAMIELLRSAVGTLEGLVDAVAAGNAPELPEDRRVDFVTQATAFKEVVDAASPAASLEWPPQDPVAGMRDAETPSPEAVPTPNIGFPRSGDEPAESCVETTPRSSVEGRNPSTENPLRSGEDPGGLTSTRSTPYGASDRRVLRDDIDNQLLPIFLDEVRDLGPLIGEDLRHLRNESNDAAAVDSLRRVLHTIKGGARMVGAIRLGELVHVMEGRLEGALEGGALSPDILDLLEGEFDRLTSGFDALEHGEAEQDSVPAPAEGVRSAPEETDARQEHTGAEAAPSLSAHIRVAAETLDRLLNQAGEISISRGRIEEEAQTFKQFLLELTDSVARLRAQLKEIEIQAESRLQATQNQATDHDPVFDPLEFDRFTRFQELTRLMAESLHDVTTVQHHLLDSLDEVQAALSAESRLNHALQEDLMRLRTVTFQNVAERLYRVARQAARETGKKAKFEVVGGQTEVDRGVLERIAAPLEHLVRNAVTHGIEAVDHRVRAGKPEAGTIRLMLRQETNDLLICLADDGQGIDHDRIRSKALELGWLPVDAQLSPSELEQMILRPGFSTATELSELAGRGVGMDVVANEVRALGGSLEIATERGQGTTFTIRVPLTLAVAKALLVSAAGRRWAILSNVVEQVQEVPGSKLAEFALRQEIEWMGHRYPVFYLPQLLGESAAPAQDRSRHFTLLIRSGDRRLAVLVDELAVNQDIVLKKIGPQLAGLPGINGASVLPNGEIVLVLNPAPLMERGRNNQTYPLETSAQQVRVAPLVMVVDDSLTVRNVTSRLLVRNGYRVTTARDGLDALQQIQEKTPDVLLVDIEMPRMDGFELTKNLKASQRTSSVPIIMITSRLAPKHREYARQLGVDIYLGKPFEEHELLAHVGTFTASVAAA